MSKILYVQEKLHHQLKQLCTNLGINMQKACDEAVAAWIEKKLADEDRKQQVFKKIESKLSKEEKEILETLLK
jgi:hypothetical protein